ncbi:23S rRNA pseudouridine(1911/1915/1917) synthase RluD [Nitrosovibrio sp. Nv6]|uniref:23S rRNA pseudouridine(1911/1915/1917) synthase RluD n=1 Tax=Nitrosovibrio sp. Nv6 TaxID=1855340 RepID=UPI0008AC1E19|nr:23S rRNA pseudouridine(1911/1915/1917) synthase RluD [Nitrosovibrio sp. Nv6]SEO76310.1 23S rRNA pseudouridine1911/1915/1917 synthase [Nitrosovibrio sp. Nv6]
MSSFEAKNRVDHYNAKPVPAESAETTIELIIPQGFAGVRLDQALAQLLPDWSRTRLQTWIRDKRISVDGAEAVPKQKVWSGEKIEVKPSYHPMETGHAPEAISLNIVYEDDALIVINKPAGLVVHPGSGNWRGTMLNALLHHAAQLSGIPRAGIVHRLDKDTSGLLVVAKTLESQTSLVRQLQDHTVKRDYLALVLGQVSTDGWVDAPVGRHPVQRTKMAVIASGKEARTHYRVLEKFDDCTLLQCSLETGRTHQIRVHMHSIGHPLLGDPVYGGKPKKSIHNTGQLLARFPRQALHAQRLELTHPQQGKRMTWEAALPEDMNSLLLVLRQCRDENPLPINSVPV